MNGGITITDDRNTEMFMNILMYICMKKIRICEIKADW